MVEVVADQVDVAVEVSPGVTDTNALIEHAGNSKRSGPILWCGMLLTSVKNAVNLLKLAAVSTGGHN
jgi:hypothetical protein